MKSAVLRSVISISVESTKATIMENLFWNGNHEICYLDGAIKKNELVGQMCIIEASFLKILILA